VECGFLTSKPPFIRALHSRCSRVKNAKPPNRHELGKSPRRDLHAPRRSTVRGAAPAGQSIRVKHSLSPNASASQKKIGRAQGGRDRVPLAHLAHGDRDGNRSANGKDPAGRIVAGVLKKFFLWPQVKAGGVSQMVESARARLHLEG